MTQLIDLIEDIRKFNFDHNDYRGLIFFLLRTYRKKLSFSFTKIEMYDIIDLSNKSLEESDNHARLSKLSETM